MPKIKMPRGSPALDMTPMVDLAFLLVTFFMLTATVRVTEPVIVDTPSSGSDKILPINIVMITISKDGKVFYNMDNPEVRIKTLEKMGDQYKIAFTEEEKKRFGSMGSFGVPMQQLKDYIKMDDVQRAKVKSPGIPTDSLNNQLGHWILFGYSEAGRKYKGEKAKAEDLKRDFKGEKPRLAIKADGKTNYLVVQNVIDIIKDSKLEPRLNFITDLEEE